MLKESGNSINRLFGNVPAILILNHINLPEKYGAFVGIKLQLVDQCAPISTVSGYFFEIIYTSLMLLLLHFVFSLP